VSDGTQLHYITSHRLNFISSLLSRASLALKYHELYQTWPEMDVPQTEIDRFHEDVMEMQQEDMAQYSQTAIAKQLVAMFEKLETDDSNSSRSSKKPTQQQAPSSSSPSPLRSPAFSLSCQRSTLPGAGDGLFLQLGADAHPEESIAPGTVVCLYPGLVHLKEYLKDGAYLRSLLPDDDFMLTARIDQAIIDARTADLTPANPFALGHKINHCGKEITPNVMQVSFSFYRSRVI
jgi:hypothetical protein